MNKKAAKCKENTSEHKMQEEEQICKYFNEKIYKHQPQQTVDSPKILSTHDANKGQATPSSEDTKSGEK